MKRIASAGFTLVEMIIVIAVIGILAAVVTIGYTGWHERSITTAMKNDLQSLASAMDDARNFTNVYPTTPPSGVKASGENVLQLVGVTASYFCADVYNASESSIILSYDSVSQDFRSYPCSGAPTGSPIGGTTPVARRNTNLSGDFTNWTLSGTAAISSGILTLGANGSALSPLVRVSAPTTIYMGGDLKAAQQSPHATLQPSAGYHITSYYYGSDGTTAVANTSGHTTNGCAKGFPIGGWQAGISSCVFNGGPNVVYARLRFNSTASGYTSPDLQIRTPLLRVI